MQLERKRSVSALEIKTNKQNNDERMILWIEIES